MLFHWIYKHKKYHINLKMINFFYFILKISINNKKSSWKVYKFYLNQETDYKLINSLLFFKNFQWKQVDPSIIYFLFSNLSKKYNFPGVIFAWSFINLFLLLMLELFKFWIFFLIYFNIKLTTKHYNLKFMKLKFNNFLIKIFNYILKLTSIYKYMSKNSMKF
jgi:hypothetical protein